MEPAVEAMLTQHNAEALDHLLTYVSSYIKKHGDTLPQGNVLPMSGLKYPLQPSPTEPDLNSALGGALVQYRIQVLIASPFVALSGETASQTTSW